jgi:hypothetical protein
MFLLVFFPVTIIPAASETGFILILLLSEPANIETMIFFFVYRRTSYLNVPSDFHCGVDELFSLLGCYAMLVGTSLPAFRDHCSFTLLSFRTTNIGHTLPTCLIIQGNQTSLCTWWLKYRKLQLMFKVSPASLQKFIDTRLTLTPSVIPNSYYVIMVSNWKFKIFLRVFVL